MYIFAGLDTSRNQPESFRNPSEPSENISNIFQSRLTTKNDATNIEHPKETVYFFPDSSICFHMHPLHCAWDVLWKWFFTPSGRSNVWFCCIHHEKTCFELIFAKGCSEDAPKVLCGGVGSLLRRFGSVLGAFWRASGGVLEPSGGIWGFVGHAKGRFGETLGPLGRVFFALESIFEAIWDPV